MLLLRRCCAHARILLHQSFHLDPSNLALPPGIALLPSSSQFPGGRSSKSPKNSEFSPLFAALPEKLDSPLRLKLASLVGASPAVREETQQRWWWFQGNLTANL